jgi:hypothetical protein
VDFFCPLAIGEASILRYRALIPDAIRAANAAQCLQAETK